MKPTKQGHNMPDVSEDKQHKTHIFDIECTEEMSQ